MVTICPTVLAENPHQFREQVERVAAFTTQIHLDFADGEFTDTRTIGLSQAWWPHSMQADLHVMYRHPAQYLDEMIALNPRMIIVHAEAADDLQALADAVHQANILFGVAVLPKTKVESLRAIIEAVDHVLIFSGDLGHFGGTADLGLLDKAVEVRKLKPGLSIGWDGGVSDENAKQLVDAGIDTLNVGGFIQHAEDPRAAYQALQKLVQ